MFVMMSRMIYNFGFPDSGRTWTMQLSKSISKQQESLIKGIFLAFIHTHTHTLIWKPKQKQNSNPDSAVLQGISLRALLTVARIRV